jgi:hypothetical protein
MRKIFTYLLCLTAVSQQTFSQATCSVSTTAPVGVTFNTPIPVNTAQGFRSPDNSQTTVGTFPNSGSPSRLTSPIYFYNTAQNTIYFAYTLSTANSNSNISAYAIDIFYGPGGFSNFGCTGGALPTLVTTTQHTYYFSISGINLPASTNFEIRLTMTIDNNQKPIIASTFTTNAIPAASGAALPVNFTAISARKKSSGVEISWNVAGERDVANYEVQRSINARDFTTVGEVTATGSDSYSFIDEKPANGISFYRVRNIDIDGKYKYTTIVRVNLNRSIELRAYPQPAKDEITIEHASAAKGILTLATATGQVVKTLQVKPDANQTSINITSLNRGLYIVRFDNGEGSIESLRVVKQ